MEDRRAVDRVKVSLNVTWKGSLGILNGEITDLSTRGCFILADDKVTLGEGVRLEIQQPVSGHLSLPAEVIYQMPEIGFGVRFTDADESEMQRLRWLVKAESLRVGNKT